MNDRWKKHGLNPAMMTRSERRLGRFLRAPEGHDGDGGAGGEGDAGDGEPGDGGAGAGGGAAGALGDDGKGGDPWFAGLPDEQADEKSLSDLAWAKNKNYADLPSMVKAMRGLEAKLASAKGIEVPGEDATPEQIAAFHRAIGAGEKVDDYGFDVPEGFEADLAILEPLRASALKAGMPVGAFKALANDYAQLMADQHNAMVTAANAERDAVFGEWGAQKDENLTLFKRGMEAFGFDPAKAERLEMALGEGGTKFLFELGLKLGRLSGEDGFIAGAPKSFGIAPEQARTELARLEKDKDFVNALQKKDPAVVARHNRLIEVIAADDARKQKEAA